jgi:hypothetical protein
MFVKIIAVKNRYQQLKTYLNNLIKYYFILALFCTITVGAQVLLPTSETAFAPMHHFNPAFIKEKNIRKITFEILDKKDYEVAEDKSLTEVYEFNDAGRLTRHYYTNVAVTYERYVTKNNIKKGNTTRVFSDYVYDTVSTSYFYTQNKLILKRYHDGKDYYESRYYRYSADGDLTKELRFKETNANKGRPYFVLGNQVMLSEDSFQYKKFSSGQVKCVLLNNEHRPYKEKIVNKDSLGREVSIYENYTAAAWIRQEYRYTYNGSKLSGARFEGNANNNIALKNTYEYDEAGELYSEKRYMNDSLLTEYSYVTGRADALLNSIIIRDFQNASIRIIKLKYDFGMVGKREKRGH